MQRWHNLYLGVTVLVTVVLGALFYTGDLAVALGLDLRSGSHITLRLLETKNPVTGELIRITEQVRNQSIQVFERRLNPEGTSEVQITPEGVDRLIVELPEVTDLAAAEKKVKKVGRLEFREQRYNPATGEMEWHTVMDGSYLKRAQPATGYTRGNWQINFELTSRGSKIFGEITERLVGKPLGIFFDGEKISAPIVQSPILGGHGVITGDFTAEEAAELANFLNAGALPVEVEIMESYTVSPTLGKEAVRASLWASVAGLVVVLLYMGFYYRLPGLAAALALVIYAVWVLTCMCIPGLKFVLTLPGVAGFVLSIGMAVDANVLIFERIKEELWRERSLKLAVDLGFQRAFSSILDGHVTTFLGALILFVLASSSVKGFGLTLMIGTALSMLTAVSVTRWFLEFFILTLKLDRPSLYGA